MWDKVVWIHPVKHRYKIRTGLTGQLLKQELTGSQMRTVRARGATQTEYAATVQEHEATNFVVDFDFSAEVTFRHGYESFNVNVSGRQLIPAGQGAIYRGQPGVTPPEGSYVYIPASAIIT